METKSILPFYIVNAQSNDETLGSVRSDSLLLGDKAITIIATPKDGYHFAGWNDGNNDNPRTFITTSDTTIIGSFETHTAAIDSAVTATCTATGLTEGSHCSVCNTVLVAQTEIPLAAHTIVTDPAVAATATETGITEGSHCSVCGTVIVAQEIVPALGEQGGNTNPGTAVAETVPNVINIYSAGNTIFVKNAKSEIRVYDAMGRLVATSNNKDTEIGISTAGVYLVKVGKETKRVMVNGE